MRYLGIALLAVAAVIALMMAIGLSGPSGSRYRSAQYPDPVAGSEYVTYYPYPSVYQASASYIWPPNYQYQYPSAYSYSYQQPAPPGYTMPSYSSTYYQQAD